MTKNKATDDTPEPRIESMDELLAPFFDACKPPSEFRIGAEAEKFGVDAKTGAALPYDGERSIVDVLSALIDRHGWVETPEREGGPLIALQRSGASITLEPGGQLELSGAPLAHLHQTCAELSGHLAELRDISEELDVVWLGIGFHPFARQADLSWVPKSRYGIMRRYLPTRGHNGLDMMRRTATVQANFDYESEAAAMRSLRIALRLSPVVTAMFANSPFYEGRVWGGRSYRAKVWLSVDPDRDGLIPKVLEEGRTFADYVEWALDAPMFVIKRGGLIIENTGQSFRSFMKYGFAGPDGVKHRATMDDWVTHLNTLFPEVRLKRTLEVRGGDSLPQSLTCALPALWTGILYDPKALDEAEALTADYRYEELSALRPDIAARALRAEFRGKPLADVASRVVDIATGGLSRRARLSRSGDDETTHLARLRSLVERADSPADVLLDGLNEGSEVAPEVILGRARV